MASPEQIELSPEPSSVAMARSFVRECVRRSFRDTSEDLIDDAMLLVSELVSNAILHGRPTIQLSVAVSRSAIEVDVSDQGDLPPEALVPVVDPRQTRGRGLHLVDLLSTSWGVRPKLPPPGKSIWFELTPERSERSLVG